MKHRLGLALFCFLLAVYLASYSPRFHSSDGLAMFSMAESLTRRGELDIDQIRWMGLQQGTFGLDGHLYSRKGAGMSLLLAPLVWLGLGVPGWGAATAALLFNSLVTAVTASLLFGAARRLGYSDRVALVAGLAFGLATLAWPYAKTCFSDPLAGLCLIAAWLALLRFRDTGGAHNVCWSGLALALAVATRYANAAFILPFAGLLMWHMWQRTAGLPQRLPQFLRDGRMWRAVGAFGAPLAAVAALSVVYNVSRYGSPLATGYLPEESFSGDWLQGVVGLLVSPGRGLFLYAPLLLLALPAAPAFLRRHRSDALLAWGVVLAHLFLYGKWFMWHGGYAWGPRFMIPTLPFLVIGLAPVIEWAGRSRGWRWAFGALAALSGLLQVVGLSVHFDLFQTQLLDTGLPLYAPVTFFDPGYSPLIGQLQFILPANLDFAWIERGTVNWPLFAALAAGVLLGGWVLWQASRPDSGRRHWRATLAALALLVAALAGFLLSQAHLCSPDDLRQAVELLNMRVRPDAAIVTGTPEEAEAFADLYKGRARALGLNVGALGRDTDAAVALQDVVGHYSDVWWLPNWLPPDKSDVEGWLMERGFRAEDLFFARQAGSDEGRRLARYYFPDGPLTSRRIGVTFGALIALESAALPDTVAPDGVLPVVLQWRALGSIPSDYRVFVHLLDAAGERVAGSDGQPAQWRRAPSSGPDGEEIEDRHALALPADLPPGDYQVIAGIYLAATGERLAADGADGSPAPFPREGFVVLGTLHVTARLSGLPTSCQVSPSAVKAHAPNAISGAACDRCISSENAAACSAKLGASEAPTAAKLSRNANTAMTCMMPIPPGAPGTVRPNASSGVNRNGANSGAGAPKSKASISG